MDHGMKKGGKAQKEKMPYKRGGYAMGGREGYPGGGEKGKPQRLPMKHGGMHDYGSVRDLEKACRGDVGYNESLKSKEDK